MKANDRQIGGQHYGPSNAAQHWDFCIENNLGYLEGSVTKYLSRWRRKGLQQDLEKAEHYAAKLVECANERLARKPYYRARRYYEVKRLEEMVALYKLTPDEAAVFRLVAEYQTAEQLNAVLRICRALLEKEKPQP